MLTNGIVYACFINSDTTEGRGPMVLSTIFEDESDAHKWVNDNDPYANVPTKRARDSRPNVSRSGMAEYRPYHVWHSYELYVEGHEREEKRAAALAKLTPEEREILGLQ